MTKKFHWDLIRGVAVAGASIVILLSILMLVNILFPLFGFFPPEWIGTIIQIATCSTLIIGYGILGWDIWEDRKTFFFFLAWGILLLVLFGNLAGIILIIVAVPIPFGS